MEKAKRVGMLAIGIQAVVTEEGPSNSCRIDEHVAISGPFFFTANPKCLSPVPNRLDHVLSNSKIKDELFNPLVAIEEVRSIRATVIGLLRPAVSWRERFVPIEDRLTRCVELQFLCPSAIPEMSILVITSGSGLAQSLR